MAETKKLEREYTIPLRRVWMRAPEYERGRKAIKAIKQFIAKHMKVEDRDIKKVKLDVYFNNEIWFRGRRHPPVKIKVKAIKDGENVKVEFAEIPEHVKFLKAKSEKIHKLKDKKETSKSSKATPEEPKAPAQDSTEKVEEKEKEKSVAELHAKEAKLDANAQKHLSKKKETSYHRMALQK